MIQPYFLRSSGIISGFPEDLFEKGRRSRSFEFRREKPRKDSAMKQFGCYGHYYFLLLNNLSTENTLNIQVIHIFCIFFNKQSSGLYLISHKGSKGEIQL